MVTLPSLVIEGKRGFREALKNVFCKLPKRFTLSETREEFFFYIIIVKFELRLREVVHATSFISKNNGRFSGGAPCDT